MLKEIMRRHRVPVIVVSSHSTSGASITLKALALGAFDFVAKPADVAARMPEIARDLIDKIKAAANSRRVRVAPISELLKMPEKVQNARKPSRVVVIGISTGGPQALQHVLSHLPGEFAGSIVVVQHMPENFTEMFSRRLDEVCAVRVKEAQSGDMLLAGRVLVCPGNRHIRVKRMPLGDVVVLSDEPRVNGHRPSVDVLFRSAATEFGQEALALIMTGMGDDGAEGMGAVRSAGGLTIAQSEDSCVVYGMPKTAIERGYAAQVVPLESLADALIAQCMPESKSAKAGSI
jgi:two-component system chemotaxis response regulator CheB